MQWLCLRRLAIRTGSVPVKLRGDGGACIAKEKSILPPVRGGKRRSWRHLGPPCSSGWAVQFGEAVPSLREFDLTVSVRGGGGCQQALSHRRRPPPHPADHRPKNSTSAASAGGQREPIDPRLSLSVEKVIDDSVPPGGPPAISKATGPPQTPSGATRSGDPRRKRRFPRGITQLWTCVQWAKRGSNPRPPRCKRGALTN